jgi:hypothetical protein
VQWPVTRGCARADVPQVVRLSPISRRVSSAVVLLILRPSRILRAILLSDSDRAADLEPTSFYRAVRDSWSDCPPGPDFKGPFTKTIGSAPRFLPIPVKEIPPTGMWVHVGACACLHLPLLEKTFLFLRALHVLPSLRTGQH